MSLGEVLFWLALTALFIILNGLFVAIEFALVALRRSRVHEMVEQRKPLSGVIQKLQKNMDTSIAGAQLGITVASLAIGWLGEHALTDALGNAINSIPGLANVYIPPGTGFVISFLILSVLHVVIGEQVPKFWALQLPEWTCRMLAVPFKFFCWLTYPLIWFMNLLARCVLAMLRIEKAKEGEHSAHTAEELEILFEASRKAGELKAQETDLLKRTLELADLTVKEIMVPRTKMDAISDDLSLRDVLSVVARTKHGKLPVFRGSSDRIHG